MFIAKITLRKAAKVTASSKDVQIIVEIKRILKYKIIIIDTEFEFLINSRPFVGRRC